LTDAWVPVSDVATRQHLRSASRHHLTVPRYRRSTFGRRAFSVGGRRPGTHCQSIYATRRAVSATSGEC